jgi:hypothetical protein
MRVLVAAVIVQTTQAGKLQHLPAKVTMAAVQMAGRMLRGVVEVALVVLAQPQVVGLLVPARMLGLV